jgi:hypothetical protein
MRIKLPARHQTTLGRWLVKPSRQLQSELYPAKISKPSALKWHHYWNIMRVKRLNGSPQNSHKTKPKFRR